MKVEIKDNKIILSNTPLQDVAGAFLIISKKLDGTPMIDVHKGQKEYDLPKDVVKKDIEALYLRVL